VTASAALTATSTTATTRACPPRTSTASRVCRCFFFSRVARSSFGTDFFFTRRRARRGGDGEDEDEDSSDCPELEAVDADDCPANDAATDALKNCDDSSLKAGDLCEADGECGTDGDINNCDHKGVPAADIYRLK
jgi:hypothetical protein